MKITQLNPLIFLLLLLVQHTQAQKMTVSYEWFLQEDGLPNRRISNLLQDSIGFIWMVGDGLHRYDGKTFKTYNTFNSSPAKLSVSNIQQILLHTEGKIWIRGRRHINVLNPKTDIVEWESGSDDFFYKRLFVHNKKIWLTAQKGNDTYLLKQSVDYQFDTIHIFPNTRYKFNLVIAPSEKELWYINNKKHLRHLNLANGAYTILDSVSYIHKRYFHDITLHLDDEHQLWIIETERAKLGMDYWDQEQQKIVPLDFADKYGGFLSFLDKERYCFIEKEDTNRKLYLINTKTRAIEIAVDLPSDVNYLDVLQVENNHLWLGTMKGILKLRLSQETPFKNYLTQLNDNPVEMRAMHELADGKVLVTTYKGVFIFDPKNGSIQPLSSQPKEGKEINRFAEYYTIVRDEYRDGFWMGAEKGFSFLQLEKKANKWFGVHESFRNANRAIRVLNHQELLTAEEYGIRKYHLQNRQFAALVTEIKDAKISQFVKTSRGDFWAISERGLLKIEEEGTLLTRYHTASPDFPLNSDIIYDLLEDRQGQLWVGTAGGLHLLNLEDFTLKTFTKQDGLPDNRVCGILEDQKGNLWLSTFHGLSQFNPNTERFINYFEEDGLPNNEFNRCSKLQTSDGLFIFGGIEGFTTFYPEKVTNSKENKSTLLLTKLSTYDAGAPKMIHTTTNLEDLKQISLSPNNKFFRLEFALLDFFSSKQHSYQWYLEGFENDWQAVSSNNFVQYNNIPAGDYTFRLRAADARGNWNDQQIAIQVSVKQFFYKTWWFTSLLLLGLLGIIFAIYHYRVQQILQIERLRIKIASDLHDEVGSLMTKISVGADMIKAKMYEEKEEEEALEKIAAQSRAATSTMSDVIWSIDARKDQLGDLLDRMKEHCEELLIPAQITYKFKATDLPLHQKIDLLLRQNLYLIFKEAINNIVKHSNATQVNITLSNTPHFEMRIQDNGTTISQKGKTGQGLVNMRMRAERIGGELRIERNDGFNILLSVK